MRSARRVAHDRDLGRVEPPGGAEGQRHAGAGLGAVAGVSAGHEVEQVGDAEPGGGVVGVRGVVHGGDSQRQAGAAQAGEQGRQVADADRRVAVVVGEVARSATSRASTRPVTSGIAAQRAATAALVSHRSGLSAAKRSAPVS